MSQYSSTAKTPGGSTVNSVLNTVSNTITITATAPGGTVGRVTIPANGDIANAVVSLRNQWTANEIISPSELSGGIRNAVLSTVNNVKSQSASNIAVAQATGTPPPNEGSAIPVNSADNPSPTPTLSEPPVPEAQEPIDPNNDPNTNIGAEAQDFVFEPLQEPPIPEADEFTGIDEQIQRQKDLEDGSLEFAGIDEQIAFNENTLQEPPQLSDEEVNDYFTQLQDERIESDTTELDFGSDPGIYYENDGTASSSTPTWSDFDRPTGGSSQGLTSSLFNTKSQATQQDSTNAYSQGDWRVRLSLAAGAKYLYKSDTPGILEPLQTTDGILFPYTPAVNVTYSSNYDTSELTHSNYKIYQYRASSVDNVSITCDFTAQDTKEAKYVLAVIHFLRSVTKMFYGQDQNPKNGTPPPLCYLTGMGAFQFDKHPLAITTFAMNLPTDVDYIRASSTTAIPGTNVGANIPKDNTYNQSLNNLLQGTTKIGFGGTTPAPRFKNTPTGSVEATYVPTKLQIQIQAVPIVTRNDISNNFSLQKYATGQLLRGSKNRGGAGIW